MNLKYFFIYCLVTFSTSSIAQNTTTPKERIENLVEYTDLQVSDDTLTQWTLWVETGESLDQEVPNRNKAWEQFLTSFYRHLGTTPNSGMREETLRNLSQYLTFPFLKGRILDFKKIGKSSIPASELITSTGSGSKHVLLIPEMGFTSALFEEFKKAYYNVFTFHEFSFPNGNDTWKYPEKANYNQASWLTKAEHMIDDYIKSFGQTEVIIIAIGSGVQLAIKLANRNTQIEGIVSINGRYQSSIIDPVTKEDASSSKRKEIANNAYPTSMVIQVSPGNLSTSYAFTKDLVKNQKYHAQITPENVNTIFRYSREFAAQDVTQNIKDLGIPMLSIVSVHNDQSSKANDLGTIQAWQELIVKHSDLPISLVKIYESQDLAFIDQPKLFDLYFKKFINEPSRPLIEVVTESKISIEAPSPLVTKSQVLETTNIKIQYSQPSLNQRVMFGEQIPYGQLWRAGANQATTFEVTNDVLINNSHILKKGRYSFFLIPGKDRWEVILNHIADQWGAFNYKKNFDALRFDVVPERTNSLIEYLTYDINRIDSDKVAVSMKWENTRFSFTLNENFELPKVPNALVNAKWDKLLEDVQGDGANPDLTDGKALSVLQKSDTLWFKYDLHQYNNKKAFAINLLIDSDFNQKTGSPWFGQNTVFTFDKALTLWMQKSTGGFQGTHGIMSPEDFTTGNQNLTYMNNIAYYLDMDKKMYVIGVAIKDLELTNKKIRVIGAVGEFKTWNDDIGDSSSAVITIKK